MVSHSTRDNGITINSLLLLLCSQVNLNVTFHLLKPNQLMVLSFYFLYSYYKIQCRHPIIIGQKSAKNTRRLSSESPDNLIHDLSRDKLKQLVNY